MLNKIKYVIEKFINNFINMEYVVDNFDVFLGRGHMLPMYQRNFCYYDRILPFLAEATSENYGESRWVIDIGANVGDTVAAMINHTKANFLCVEPDEIYFGILKNNVAKWELMDRIILENVYVAMDTSKYLDTERIAGTARMTETNISSRSGISGVTLQDLIRRRNIDFNSIDLIKVDTDGYDWQCLLSLDDVLDDCRFALYWENAIESAVLYNGYQKLTKRLHDAGYCYFFIFDNFGNFLSEGDYNLLSSVNDYLFRGFGGHAPRKLPRG